MWEIGGDLRERGIQWRGSVCVENGVAISFHYISSFLARKSICSMQTISRKTMCPRIIFANKGGKRLTNFQFGRFVLRKVQQFSPQHPGINLHLVISRHLADSRRVPRVTSGHVELRTSVQPGRSVSNSKTPRTLCFWRIKSHHFCISREWRGTHPPRRN